MELTQHPQLPRPIARVFVRGCSDETRTELRSRIPIHEGAILSGDLLERTRQVAKTLHDGFEIAVTPGLGRQQFLKLPPHIQKRVGQPACDDGVNVTIYDPASLPQRIRIEGGEQESRLIEKVMPLYPGPAEGVVKLSIVIGKDGTVLGADPVSGPQALMEAAIHAVKQWKYRPTLLNGLPVEVRTNVELP